MTTRNKITEQCERLYLRAFPDKEDLERRVERREVALLVDQVANELLALEPRQLSRMGTIEIPTSMIATYFNQPVYQEPNGGRFFSVLAAFPIRLPMDMGVWSVSSATETFIPVQTEFFDLLGKEPEGLLENQIGFYVEGRKIFFTRNPNGPVRQKLLIVDPSLLSPFDPYPIPADMEAEVVTRVVAILSSRGLVPDKPKA
jgi:hypothetical protein